MRNGRTGREVEASAVKCAALRLCALALVACLSTAAAQPPGSRQPMQGQRAGGQKPVQRFWQSQPNNAGPNATRGEHLQQWMQQHNQLTSQQQQQALQHEAGFHQLPQETQQRMLNRLDRLNSMPPEQRARGAGAQRTDGAAEPAAARAGAQCHGPAWRAAAGQATRGVAVVSRTARLAAAATQPDPEFAGIPSAIHRRGTRHTWQPAGSQSHSSPPVSCLTAGRSQPSLKHVMDRWRTRRCRCCC